MRAKVLIRYGTRYRSITEAHWAACLGDAKYEPRGFDFRQVVPNNPFWPAAYLPDFWLPKRDVWLEVKGNTPSMFEYRKAALLAEVTGCKVMIAPGRPGQFEQFICTTGLSEKPVLVDPSELVPTDVFFAVPEVETEMRNLPEVFHTAFTALFFHAERNIVEPYHGPLSRELDPRAYEPETQWTTVLPPGRGGSGRLGRIYLHLDEETFERLSRINREAA